VPYVSKATGMPLAKVAARCMAGRTLIEQGVGGEVVPSYYSVKEAVFPFRKFPGVDTILGPEMKSTGEVMGVGESFAEAFLKAQMAAGERLPTTGSALISVGGAERLKDRSKLVAIASDLVELGFKLYATRGTAEALAQHGVQATVVNKVAEGRPHVVDKIKNKEIDFIVNVAEDKRAVKDSYAIRAAALANQITYFTTLAGARAACLGMRHVKELSVYDVRGLHRGLAA
jgi:carbamoyl-phosphate synthase large subunit